MKTAYSQYCYLRGNRKIRAAIIHRINERKVVKAELARKVGIQPSHFSNYLAGENKTINQSQLFAIAKELGIEIDITVTFI